MNATKQKYSREDRKEIEALMLGTLGTRKLKESPFEKDGSLRDFALSLAVVEQLCAAVTLLVDTEGVFRVSGNHIQVMRNRALLRVVVF